ncbi:MAG TPA: hypothetical protein V6D22_22245 [Candidatus Obscuribacterales bacterium]
MQLLKSTSAERALAASAPSPSSYSWTYIAAWAALFLYTVVATFPKVMCGLDGSIDGHLRWALNYLAASGTPFGEKAVFTFGPLGFLIEPLNMGFNQVAGVSVALLSRIVLLSLVFLVLWRHKAPLWQASLFSLLMCFGVSFGHHGTEISLALLVSTLGATALVVPSAGFILALAMGVLAACCAFMKANLGVGALLSVVASAVCWHRAQSDTARSWIAGAVSAYVAVFAILSCLLLHSIRNLWLWAYGTAEIIGGYADASTLPASPVQLITGCVVVVAYCIAVALLGVRKKSMYAPAFIFFPCVLISFKHGFVRQDLGHEVAFVIEIITVLALLAAFATSKRATIAAFASGLAFCAAVLSWGMPWLLVLPQSADTLCCRQGTENIRQLLHWRSLMTEEQRQNEIVLQPMRLDSDTLAEIKKRNADVDVVPAALAVCAANRLIWNPNPTLQIYAASTSYLDKISAAHFTGTNAPKVVLAGLDEIDQRHTFFSNPQTWRALLSNYQPIGPRRISSLALVKSAPTSTNWCLLPNLTRARVDSWITVPPAHGLLYGHIHVERSWLGMLSAAIYQTPEMDIDLKFASGAQHRYRVVRSALQEGVLLNFLPTDIRQLDALFQGHAFDRITNFRLSCLSPTFLKPEMSVVWEEQPRTVEYRLDASPVHAATQAELPWFAVDAVCGNPPSSHMVVDSKTKELITVAGWIVNKDRSGLPRSVFLSVDNKQLVPVHYGISRRDVASALQDERLKDCGFLAVLRAADLAPGGHRLRLAVPDSPTDQWVTPPWQVVVQR